MQSTEKARKSATGSGSSAVNNEAQLAQLAGMMHEQSGPWKQVGLPMQVHKQQSMRSNASRMTALSILSETTGLMISALRMLLHHDGLLHLSPRRTC